MAFCAILCKILAVRPSCLGEVVASSSGWASGLGSGSLGFREYNSAFVLWLEGVGVV